FACSPAWLASLAVAKTSRASNHGTLTRKLERLRPPQGGFACRRFPRQGFDGGEEDEFIVERAPRSDVRRSRVRATPAQAVAQFPEKECLASLVPRHPRLAVMTAKQRQPVVKKSVTSTFNREVAGSSPAGSSVDP